MIDFFGRDALLEHLCLPCADMLTTARRGSRNALLILRSFFARYVVEKSPVPLCRRDFKPLIDAALEGARLRLRPILMTSFAFIFGCLPLWFASGSGAVACRVLGSTVIGGMIAASAIAIFLIPVTFYVIERLFAGQRASVSIRGDANDPR